MDITLQIDLSFRPVRNPRTLAVAESFEMGDLAGGTFQLLEKTTVTLRPGELAYLVGASGSGKSQLLAALAARWPAGRRRARRVVSGTLGGEGRRRAERRGHPHPVSPVKGEELPRRRAVLDELGLPIEPALRLLAAAGLGEARLWLMPAGCLSAGQADRLALAKLYAAAERKRGLAHLSRPFAKNVPVPSSGSGPADDAAVLLLIDEFGSRLDRLTARILAANLRRWLDRSPGVAVVVASAHDDLAGALRPDWVWVKTAEVGLKVLGGGRTLYYK